MYESVIAGSLPKPTWLVETQTLWPQWGAQGDELLQAKRDATLLWIKLQEDAAGWTSLVMVNRRASTLCMAFWSRWKALILSTRSP